jgi:hypothetical protein
MATMVCTVICDNRELHAKLALGMQEWLKRAASGHMDVLDAVCQALELKISMTLASLWDVGSCAYRERYCSCCEVVRFEYAVVTAALVRGS